MKFRGLPDQEGVVERRNACLVTLSWSCRVPRDLAAASTLIARRFRPALTGKIYFFKWTENRARVFHALNRDVPFENYVERECCTLAPALNSRLRRCALPAAPVNAVT
jgi:hypothetical protein